MKIEIRAAKFDEATKLTAIAQAAKQHWQYPASWLAQWQTALTITEQIIATQIIAVAINENQLIGFYGLSNDDQQTIVLEHLWVLPAYIGKGVGQQLWQHAINHARKLGFTAMIIDADPNAAGFYLRQGATCIGSIPADIDNQKRTLPRLKFSLIID